MKILTLIYIINASLLLLHEIESAYVKEWEILKLPGKITGGQFQLPGQPVNRHKTQIMPGFLIFPAGISQSDN